MNSIDITLGESDIKGIYMILGHIRPNWIKEQVVIKNLKGGHVNSLYACGLSDDVAENDHVIVRVFEHGADHLIDREKELLGMRIGHHEGLAAPIYCTFNNGIVYKYQRGCQVDFSNQTDETLARAVAKSLAKLHLTDYKRVLETLGEGDKIVKYKSRYQLGTFLEETQSAIPDHYDDSDKEKIRLEEFMTKAEALTEMQRLDGEIDEMNFPLVFSHNDLNTGNIIFDKYSEQVHFVDWEGADICYAVHDIGVFFLTHAYNAAIKCDPEQYKLYPSKEYQLKWIRWYLEYKAELSGEDPQSVTDHHLQRMYVGANLSAMAFGLFAAQWGLSQEGTSVSPIDFFAFGRHLHGLLRVVQRNMNNGI